MRPAWPLPHLDVVSVPSAHALNHSHPQLVAELIEAYIAVSR